LINKLEHSFGTAHFLNYSENDFACLISYQIVSPHKAKKKKCKTSQTVQLPHSSSHKTALIRHYNSLWTTLCKTSHNKYALRNRKRAHLLLDNTIRYENKYTFM